MESEIMRSPHIQKAGIAVLVLLALFLAAKTISEFAGIPHIGAGEPVQHTISVQGEGSVSALPDTAQFSFAAVVERETVAAAQEAASQRVNSAISFLKEQGVAEEDIKTQGYNVYPRYDYVTATCREGLCPPGQRQLRGFEVRQTVQVKTQDLENVGTLLAGLGEIGVTEMSSLNFTVDDDEALMHEARTMAIDDAKAKAEKLADALGVKLVRIVSFSENGSGVPFYARTEGLGGDAAASTAPNIPTGENEIRRNVSITYELR